MVVTGLIWDEWNKEHIARHNVSIKEVEEVCQSNYQVIESYRKRILILGKTKAKRNLAVVLSPEDRNLKYYGSGIYYIITAFEKEVEK
ncbi:MAG TPA: DUF4258 domain-containing protein [Candidatus Sulfotelmatobacter sp.]|nr:DUF4258 domain-containing protein [Candidatus Sulfotelmatobacter sp.]